MRWCLLCFLTFILFSCHSALDRDRNAVNMRLAADSQSVYISGLDYAVLNDLKNDSLSTQGWQSLLSVYRMPADTDMKDLQKQQPGKYLITDSSIVFKPDTAFKKHQQYFARFYGGALANGKTDVFLSKTKIQGSRFKEVVFSF